MFPFPFDYELGASELRIKVGRWAVRRLAYRDIAEVSLLEGRWVCWQFGLMERWVNFGGPASCLLIRRRDRWLGLEKIWLINPLEPERFRARLEEKLPK